MSFISRFPFIFAAAALLLAGCVETGTAVKTGATEEAASGSQPDKPVTTVTEAQTKRQLERELDRDVTGYHKKLVERNVDDALEYVIPEARAAKQADLWQFFSEYSVENFEIVQKDIDFKASSPRAVVKASLIVYQKNVVNPQRKEQVSTWVRIGDKWFLQP